MSGTRLRSSVVLLALVAGACSATACGIGAAPAPARQPSVTTDVVYGHKDGLALTFDVHCPTQPNGAGVIAIVSGGWKSSVEMGRLIAQNYPPLNEKGFTVFAVRHGSSPRYPMSAIVADMRRAVLHPSARRRLRRRPQPHWRVWRQRRRAARAAARYDSRLRGSVGLRRGAQGIQSRRCGRGLLSAHGSLSRRSGSDRHSRP
jgi:hypothetical protein